MYYSVVTNNHHLTPWVRNSGRAQPDGSSVPHGIRGSLVSLSWWLSWRAWASFTLMSGTLQPGRLGSAGTFHQGAYLWLRQHGGLMSNLRDGSRLQDPVPQGTRLGLLWPCLWSLIVSLLLYSTDWCDRKPTRFQGREHHHFSVQRISKISRLSFKTTTQLFLNLPTQHILDFLPPLPCQVPSGLKELTGPLLTHFSFSQ